MSWRGAFRRNIARCKDEEMAQHTICLMTGSRGRGEMPYRNKNVLANPREDVALMACGDSASACDWNPSAGSNRCNRRGGRRVA